MIFAKTFCFIQQCLPQHTLSRFIGIFTNSKNKFIKSTLIKLCLFFYAVDLKEAEDENIENYTSFNNFFTRKLKPNVRTIDTDKTVLISPVDGTIYQFGKIEDKQLFQAKGKYFSLETLLGQQQDLVAQFINGSFLTAYLAPKDYHRVHIPYSGKLKKMVHVPGKLFAVNPTTTNNIANLFARNERVICLFETSFGPMIIILVGAMIVASIHTVWAGEVTPPTTKEIRTWNYDNGIELNKGDELGHFQMGSTVIILIPENKSEFSTNLQVNQTIKLGEYIAKITS